MTRHYTNESQGTNTMSDKALALIPQDLPGFTALAKQFAESKLIPSDLQSKPADVFVTLLAGNELGLSPMAALRGIHVVKGKTILSADTMVAVVLASGAAEYFRRVEATATTATYETKRKGAEPVQVTWTSADAVTAKLDGDNWKKYPRAMLAARCKAELARDVYPDVLAGCYDEGELEVDDAPPPTITPINGKRPSPVAVPPAAIEADFTDATPAAASLSWDAFVADVLTMTGLKVGDEDDVGEEWARILGRATRQEIDADTKALLGAIEKHKSDYRVAALRDKCLSTYRARIAEIRAAATQVAAP